MSSGPLTAPRWAARPARPARPRPGRDLAPNWPLLLERGLLLAGLACTALLGFQFGSPLHWDVSLYHSYAVQFWEHWPPRLPNEYPPLAEIPFALTLIPPSLRWPLAHHGTLLAPGALYFSAGVAAMVVATHHAFTRFATPLKALAFAIYILAVGAATLLLRYDLIPALLTLGALWLLQRGRFSWAYALLAAGALTKIFPLALVPVVMIAQWQVPGRDPRQRLTEIARGAVPCLVAVAAGFGLALLADPAHGLGAFTYDARRPIQIESVPASVLWVGSFLGEPIHAVQSFSSLNLVGNLTPAVLLASSVATVAGCLATWWYQLRGRIQAGHAAIATILVLIATSRVLSPQYMVWLAPLVAAVYGFEFRWLLLFALTSVIFPLLYQTQLWYPEPNVPVFHWPLLAGIALRNLLLVAITVRLALLPPAARASDRMEGAIIHVRRFGMASATGRTGAPASLQNEG